MTSTFAAVLRVDVVGFTAITDQMSLDGPVGAERLADVIGRFIRNVATIAEASGGELTTLAGDAGLFVWFVASDDELPDAIIAASAAGLAIRRNVADGRSGLMARCTVGSGLLHHFEIGGRECEWHAVLSGPGFEEAATAARVVGPGELGLAKNTWHRVHARCRCADERQGVVIVTQTEAAAPFAGLLQHRPTPIPPVLLRASIAHMIVERHEQTPSWGGEFRTITVAFTVLRHIEHARPQDALATIQESAQLVQDILARFEGRIHQIRADEDGITVISVFGLPPFAHEDDATRCTQAALALHQAWSGLGATTSTGIATGRVFATTLGESGLFTLVGPAMNLAARLMQLNAGVVCDSATVQAGRQHRRIAARELAPRTVKGKSEPISAFAPFATETAHHPATSDAPFVGRGAQLAELAKAIGDVASGIGRLVVIEGPAGIGKSALLGQIHIAAEKAGISVIEGFGDDTERRSPFFAWRPVFHAMFKTAHLAAAERIRRVVIALGDNAHLAPLLSDVLDLGLSDSPVTHPLTGEVRAAGIRKLLLERLTAAANESPTVLILDDIHWMDTSSLDLLVHAAEAGLPLLIVGAIRPDDTASDASLARLVQLPRAYHMHLTGLSADDAARIVAHGMDAADTSTYASDFVVSRTGGNPLFIMEMIPVLRESGLLVVDKNEADIVNSSAVTEAALDRALASKGVPSSLEGIVLARFDGLSPSRKVLLQAAAVVGQTFSIDEIDGLVPGVNHHDGLSALIESGFLTRSIDERGGRFRHALIRDVVYNTLSFADRRGLHARLGEALARSPLAHTGALDAVLGHHFGAGDNDERAVHHLLGAAARAQRIFANSEAIAHAKDAIGHIARMENSRSARHERANLRQARAEAEMALGTAYHRLSRYSDARRHLEGALRLLRESVPKSSLRLASATIMASIIEAFYLRFRGIRFPPPHSLSARRGVSAAGALEQLVEVYFFEQQSLRAVHGALRSARLSRNTGSATLLSRAYATLSGITMQVRFRSASSKYRRLALDLVTGADDFEARIWVYLVTAIVEIGLGNWRVSIGLLDAVGSAADQVGFSRRWRDAVELRAAIDATRGNWQAASEGIQLMITSARRDKDRRYLANGLRELAHYQLHGSQSEAADVTLATLGDLLASGLQAQEAEITLHYLVLVAANSLLKGEEMKSGQFAGQAVTRVLAGGMSFPFSYWSDFLLFRILVDIQFSQSVAANPTHCARQMSIVEGCLRRKARVHPIAGPAALIATGCLQLIKGSRSSAQKNWENARRTAGLYDMNVEQGMSTRLLDLAELPTHLALGPVMVRSARSTG